MSALSRAHFAFAFLILYWRSQHNFNFLAKLIHKVIFVFDSFTNLSSLLMHHLELVRIETWLDAREEQVSRVFEYLHKLTFLYLYSIFLLDGLF